ncbi:TlpA family protein disulfide reductase [Cohnella herbarum]|uniref:Redoxin domain-containing protein n=1 Tax=Cohnella herbarum TaxID=2728023 RepID=A0A7Z2ZNZ3_9BACL|nr:redoxin domain-containing protein [Cohnella herbarum]QJD85522.1 redoxin domain-containing protein [Cohnella herbarum]
MPNIQVGTFVLNIELLIYIVAGMVGVLAVHYRQRRHPDRERIVSDAWNAVFLWILVWKGSLFLFDPASVIAQPLSLAFFSGGAKGMWLASLIVAAFLGFRHFRRLGARQTAAVIAVMGAGWAMSVTLAQIVFSDSAGNAVYLIFVLSGAAMVLLLSPSPRYAAQAFVILLVGTAILYTLLDSTERAANSPEERAASGAEVGARKAQLAPEFELTDLEGNSVKLSDYRGKTVLLNFWATWCRVCQAEMPHVEKLYRQYKDQDVIILSVNATSQERDVQRVAQYANKELLSFPIVLDEEGDVLKRYKVTAYPTTYIIDPSGVIQDRYLGAISYESMKKAVRKA